MRQELKKFVLIATLGLLGGSTAKAACNDPYFACARRGHMIVVPATYYGPGYVSYGYGGYYGGGYDMYGGGYGYGDGFGRGFEGQMARTGANILTGELYRSGPVAAGMLGNVLVTVVGRTVGAVTEAILPAPPVRQNQQPSANTEPSVSLREFCGYARDEDPRCRGQEW